MTLHLKKYVTLVLLATGLSLTAVGQIIVPHFPVNSNLPSAEDFEKAAQKNKLTEQQYLVIVDAHNAAQSGNSARASSLLLRLGVSTQNVQYLKAAVRYAIEADDLLLAFKAVEFWLQFDPQDDTANQVEIALGEMIKVRPGFGETLRQYIAQSDNKPEAIGRVQRLVSVLPDKDLAYQLLETALADVKDTSEALKAMSEMSARLKSFTTAVDYAKKSLDADPKSESAAINYFTLLAPTNFQAGQKLAIDFITNNPNSSDKLRIVYARVLVQAKDKDGALAQLKQARDINPNNIDAWFLSGVIEYEAKDYDAAKASLEKAIATEKATPRNADSETYMPVRVSTVNKALALLAEIAERQGRINDAIDILASMEGGDLSFSGLLERARLIAKRDGITEGLRAVRLIVPLSEQEEDSRYIAEADMLTQAGRIEEAIGVLKRNARYDGSYDLKLEYALKLLDVNRVDDAEEVFDNLIKTQPYDFRAYTSLGFMLLDRNIDPDEAEKMINKAYQLRPNHPQVLDAKGWLAFHQGKLDDAVKYLQRGVQLTRKVEVDVHLGEVYWAMGKRDDAISVWKNAQQDDPDNAYLKVTLQRLGVNI